MNYVGELGKRCFYEISLSAANSSDMELPSSDSSSSPSSGFSSDSSPCSSFIVDLPNRMVWPFSQTLSENLALRSAKRVASRRDELVLKSGLRLYLASKASEVNP